MKKNHPSFTSQQCQRAGPLFSWFPAPVAEAVLDATQRWHGQQRDPAEKQRFTCLVVVLGIYFGSIKVNVREKKPFAHLPVPMGNEKLKHTPCPQTTSSPRESKRSRGAKAAQRWRVPGAESCSPRGRSPLRPGEPPCEDSEPLGSSSSPAFGKPAEKGQMETMNPYVSPVTNLYEILKLTKCFAAMVGSIQIPDISACTPPKIDFRLEHLTFRYLFLN